MKPPTYKHCRIISVQCPLPKKGQWGLKRNKWYFRDINLRKILIFKLNKVWLLNSKGEIMLALPVIRSKVPPEMSCYIKLPKTSSGTSAYTGDLGWHTHKIHKHLYMHIFRHVYPWYIYIYISSLTTSANTEKIWLVDRACWLDRACWQWTCISLDCNCVALGQGTKIQQALFRANLQATAQRTKQLII